MNAIFRKSLVLLAFWGFSATVGQTSDKELYFNFSIWIMHEDDIIKRADIFIYEEDKRLWETRSNRWGNFRLSLLPNKDYRIVIKEDGFKTKTTFINTKIENKNTLAKKDLYYEFIAELYSEENTERSAHEHHRLVFDVEKQDFIEYQPNVTEHLKIKEDIEKPVHFEVCNHTAMLS